MEPFKDLGKRLSNWGRWGDDDQRGTLNLVERDHVVAAAALVRTGSVFELSIPLGNDGPQTGAGGRVNPVHLMSIMPADLDIPDGLTVADDFLMMPLQSATQWDSLAHVGYDGRLYNDVPAASVHAMGGATRNSVEHAMPGFVGRGVLVDVARHRGVEWLAAEDEIGPDELQRIADDTGVRFGPGDALVVRTGWRRKAVVEGFDPSWIAANPGLTLECAEWIHATGFATVVSDNWGIERQPSPDPDAMLPLHCVLIRDMGMMLGEIFDLEELAADCAADGRYEFLLVAPPLRVVGGVGSPTSPIAVK